MRDIGHIACLATALLVRATPRSAGWLLLFLSVFAAPAGAEEARTGIPRVKVMVVKMGKAAPDIVIPGDIQARYLSNTSFRLNGKISERLVEVGDHVTADQVLAKIDPDQQQSAMRTAEATLASAEATWNQAKQTFARQQELMKDRFTTQVSFDQAEEQVLTAQAQVEFARAQIGSYKEQLSYTELKAGVAGIITLRNGEVGQVVKEGDTIFTIAQDGHRDAVFNVYEALFAKAPARKDIQVVLIADPSIRVSATVREIAPRVDATSGAVKVKATLQEFPPSMSLGASVIGLGSLEASDVVTLPWSALYFWQGEPAVWMLDANANVVLPRRVRVESYADKGMVLKSGIADGDRVIVAGIQFLRPGQKVEVVETIKP